MRKEKMANKLDGGIRISLFTLIFLLPFSNSAVEICFGFAFVLWVVKHLLLKSFKVEPSILNKPICIFIFIGIFSVISSVYFKDSLYAFFSKFMEGILLYFIILETIKQKKYVSIIIGLFLFVALVVSIDGIIQYFFTGIDIFRQRLIVRDGATAAFSHPNKFGAYLLFPLFMTLGVLMDRLKAKRINLKLLGLCCVFGLLFFIFVFTKSRGAWVGFVMAALFIIFYINRRVFLITMIVIAVISPLVLSIAPDSLLGSFRIELERVRGGMPIHRMRIWRDTVDMIKDRPVFGHGINTYTRLFEKYRTVPQQGSTYAHNSYLQMTAEMGLAGLIAFLWIIIRFFRSNVNKRAGYASLGIEAGLFAFLIHSFFDTNLYSLQLNILFWFMLGLAAAKAKIYQ